MGQKQRRIKTVKGEITITPAYGYVRVSGVGQGDSERDGIARQKDTVRKYRCGERYGRSLHSKSPSKPLEYCANLLLNAARLSHPDQRERIEVRSRKAAPPRHYSHYRELDQRASVGVRVDHRRGAHAPCRCASDFAARCAASIARADGAQCCGCIPLLCRVLRRSRTAGRFAPDPEQTEA